MNVVLRVCLFDNREQSCCNARQMRVTDRLRYKTVLRTMLDATLYFTVRGEKFAGTGKYR